MLVLKEPVGPNQAELTAYIQDASPEMANASVRPAVLVFPGGGYFICSDREAEPVALAYLAQGYNAFVLRYSVGRESTFTQALADAEAALAHIKSDADRFAIDPNKIAVVGFSAGGHLAACLGTLGADRPAALVLGYPAILARMGEGIGKDLPGADEHVTKDTPPTFLFSTSNDEVVPIENTLAFSLALARHGVLFEQHIYLDGEHGVSLADTQTSAGRPGMVNPDAAQWFARSVRFLRKTLGDFELTEDATVLSDIPKGMLDVPIGDLLKHSACRDILIATIPMLKASLDDNPMVKIISLRKMAAFSNGTISDDLLQKLNSELGKLQKDFD